MSWILPWAELDVGELYFLLGYHDPDRFVPYIESLIYLGSEVDPTEGTIHRFAYANEQSLRGEYADDEIVTFLDSDPSCIGDLSGLVKELQLLASRKK